MARPALLFGFLVLAGCPGKPSSVADAGDDAGVVGVTPVELCERLAAARCALVVRCYTAFAQEDLAACLPLEQQRCIEEYESLRAAFEEKLVTVDATRLGSCETRMQSSSCPPTFPPNYPAIAAHPFSDCGLQTGLLIGNVASGQTCVRAVDCEPGSVCIKPGGVCKGTCSKWPQVNEACSFGCNPGLICDEMGTVDPADDRCIEPHVLNEPCLTSLECALDLICSGTCRARSKAGESCVFDANRLSTCDPGLACDVTPFVMGAVGKCVTPQPIGARCQFHWTCTPGQVCADLDFTGFPTASPAPGFCRKPSEENTNCPATQYQLYVGDQCGQGTVCNRDMRKCLVAPKQSEDCTPSSQSCVGVGIYCKPNGSGDVGRCTGPASTGERCAFEIDATRKVTVPCSTGYCDTVTTLSCQAASKTINALCTEDGQCMSKRCAVQQDRTLRCAQACN